MLPSWASDTIIRLRPTTREVRGSVIPDWSNPDTLTIYGCSIQPAGTSLSQDGRVQGITDGYTCYLPPGSDVLAGDRIKFNGQIYAIKGEPREWRGPTCRTNNLLLNIERWEG